MAHIRGKHVHRGILYFRGVLIALDSDRHERLENLHPGHQCALGTIYTYTLGST